MDSEDDGDIDENRACYVLQRGSSAASQRDRPSGRNVGGKRVSKDTDDDDDDDGGDALEGGQLPLLVDEPPVYGQWRFQAFHAVWGRMQKLIEDILEDQNQGLYEEMQQWIFNRQYGDAQLDINQLACPGSSAENAADQAVMSRYLLTVRKQMHTALLLLGGIDPSDHHKTMDGLIGHLRKHRCHVARLTSLNFAAKGGVGGPLRALFRQLIDCVPQSTDMEILRAWHSDPDNDGRPVVILIENAEASESKVLADLILLLSFEALTSVISTQKIQQNVSVLELSCRSISIAKARQDPLPGVLEMCRIGLHLAIISSDWVKEIPLVLIMGMTTTGDAVGRILPSNALVRLGLWRFTLKPPSEMLEVVLRAVVVDSFCAFELSHEVVSFLYKFFRRHDVTVTALSRALKISSIEHFWKQPLSFLCGKILKFNSKSELEQECAALPQQLMKLAATLPSVTRSSQGEESSLPLDKQMAATLCQLRAYKKSWAMAFLSLQAVGKHTGLGFADLLHGALSGYFAVAAPSADNDRVGETELRTTGGKIPQAKRMHHHPMMIQVMAKLRDMPAPILKGVLEAWRKVTIHDKDLNSQVCHLLMDFDGGAKDKPPPPSFPCSPESKTLQAAAANQDFTVRVMNRSTLRRMGHAQLEASKGGGAGAERTGVQTIRVAAEELFERILSQHLVPPESRPFCEIFCFQDVTSLKQALIGETRTRIHQDLLRSREGLKCNCCPVNDMLADASLHDTSLAYILSQQHGDVIRVPAWYRSFAATCDPDLVGGPEQEEEERGGQKKKEGKGRKDRRRKKGRQLAGDMEPCPSPPRPAPPYRRVPATLRPPIENFAMEARFTRAATELQIVGLLQLPKKGQSDSVRRLCM